MKNVLICAAQVPFVVGGAEILVQELRESLRSRGYRVDVASVPFKGYPVSQIVRQALVWRLLDITASNGDPVDLVIPTKFPSYLVAHPRKVPWLFHQHREAYDLAGTEYSALTDSLEHRRISEAIRALDDVALGECSSVYTISRNVADRLRQYNGIEGVPLYPPPHSLGRHYCEAYDDYLLCVGRLELVKRPQLVVEALSRTSSRVRLKIVGTGALETELRRRIERLAVADRVELLGHVPDDELLALYARCRGTVYVPHNEDYGYVTVESFLSRKPVLTTDDSGGVLEFVENEVCGLVSSPTPDELADAMDRLWEMPPSRLAEMGAAGHSRVQDISWDRVIDHLTESVR